MGCSSLDLRQNTCIDVKIDKGTDGTIVFDFSGSGLTMDAGYTLVFDPELTTEQTYTVGSGLTINGETVEWVYGTEFSQERMYRGRFESDDQTSGTYVRFFINLEVSI